MPTKQILTVLALVAVCSWSAVMAALGQVAAVAALIPSLGLLVQQIATSLGDSPPATPPSPAPPAEPAAAAHQAAAGEERAQ